MPKIFFRRIHLYLGLLTGLVLTITCLTGAILVYEKELKEWLHPSRYYHSESTGQRLSIDEVVSKVKKELHTKPNSIKVYNDPKRNVEVSIPKKSNKEVNKVPSKRPPSLTVFVNPYTGEIVEVYDNRETFFFFVMDLHRWMLSGDTGKWIVGSCTLIFLFIIVTGLILWWPKNKAILLQRLKFKWKAGWKRWNHDFHIVIGFYSSIFLFIFAFTGLAWSFEWFNDGIYKVTGTKNEKAPTYNSIVREDSSKYKIQYALNKIQSEVPAYYYQIQLPKKPDAAYTISLLPHDASMDVATSQYFVDQYSGEILGVNHFRDKNTGQKVRAAFKPIHTATIWGQFSKLIGFLACIVGTLLPITGVILWWNRTMKKRK